MNKIIKLLFVGCLVSLLGCSNTSAVIAKEIKNDEVKITYSQVAGKYIERLFPHRAPAHPDQTCHR